VLNSPEHALGGETNQVTLVEARSAVEIPEMDKREIAERILDRVIELRGGVREGPELKLAENTKPSTHRAANVRGKGKR